MTITQYQCDKCLTIFDTKNVHVKEIRFREWNTKEDGLGCDEGHYEFETYCSRCVMRRENQ